MTADPITGKTIRWSYEDGPTKGSSFEHTFGRDGTVTYRMLEGKAGSGDAAPSSERCAYQVAPVRANMYVVTYLAPSGWTLTTVLDLDAGTMVSVASNEKQVFVQRGTFAVIEPA